MEGGGFHRFTLCGSSKKWEDLFVVGKLFHYFLWCFLTIFRETIGRVFCCWKLLHLFFSGVLSWGVPKCEENTKILVTSFLGVGGLWCLR